MKIEEVIRLYNKVDAFPSKIDISYLRNNFNPIIKENFPEVRISWACNSCVKNQMSLLLSWLNDKEAKEVEDKVAAKIYRQQQAKMAKGGTIEKTKAKKRLEEIRKSLNNENISYGELAELESLKKFIDEYDVQLREAAGIPEFGKGGEIREVKKFDKKAKSKKKKNVRKKRTSKNKT